MTLIELMIVTIILTLIAGTIIPRISASIASDQYRRSAQKLETAVNRAHSQAATDGQIHVVGFDASTQSITDTIEESTTPSATTLQAPTRDNQTDTASKGTALGSDWSFSESKADLSDSNNTELSIRFYPDGTADPTTAFFRANDLDVTLRVSRAGEVSVRRGKIETSSNQEWAAGDLEQRSVQN